MATRTRKAIKSTRTRTTTTRAAPQKAAKSGNKMVPTGAGVDAFIDAIKDEDQRQDARALLALMRRASGFQPRMWGRAIVGFGSYHYKYASGREGDWYVTGFSPRKGTLTVYILPGLHLQTANLKTLGTFTRGQSCLYIKRLADVHLPTLETMVKQALVDIRKFTPLVSA